MLLYVDYIFNKGQVTKEEIVVKSIFEILLLKSPVPAGQNLPVLIIAKQ